MKASIALLAAAIMSLGIVSEVRAQFPVGSPALSSSMAYFTGEAAAAQAPLPATFSLMNISGARQTRPIKALRPLLADCTWSHKTWGGQEPWYLKWNGTCPSLGKGQTILVTLEGTWQEVEKIDVRIGDGPMIWVPPPSVRVEQ